MLHIITDKRMPTGVMAIDDDAQVALHHPKMSGPQRSLLLVEAGYCPNAAGGWERPASLPTHSASSRAASGIQCP